MAANQIFNFWWNLSKSVGEGAKPIPRTKWIPTGSLLERARLALDWVGLTGHWRRGKCQVGRGNNVTSPVKAHTPVIVARLLA